MYGTIITYDSNGTPYINGFPVNYTGNTGTNTSPDTTKNNGWLAGLLTGLSGILSKIFPANTAANNTTIPPNYYPQIQNNNTVLILAAAAIIVVLLLNNGSKRK